MCSLARCDIKVDGGLIVSHIDRVREAVSIPVKSVQELTTRFASGGVQLLSQGICYRSFLGSFNGDRCGW